MKVNTQDYLKALRGKGKSKTEKVYTVPKTSNYGFGQGVIHNMNEQYVQQPTLGQIMQKLDMVLMEIRALSAPVKTKSTKEKLVGKDGKKLKYPRNSYMIFTNENREKYKKEFEVKHNLVKNEKGLVKYSIPLFDNVTNQPVIDPRTGKQAKYNLNNFLSDKWKEIKANQPDVKAKYDLLAKQERDHFNEKKADIDTKKTVEGDKQDTPSSVNKGIPVPVKKVRKGKQPKMTGFGIANPDLMSKLQKMTGK